MSRREQINIRATEEEKKTWETLSQKLDLPISDIARRLLNGLASGQIKQFPLGGQNVRLA